MDSYNKFRQEFQNIAVLGGVWPKYYTPVFNSNLENDLKQGVKRANAIVVTGSGTGKETPLEKIEEFRKIIGNYPLIVGAGLNINNAYEQLSIADGAIVGSCLKYKEITEKRMDKIKVRDLMDVVREVRGE
jgi:predicted TIM-barrel enzyme